MSYFAESPIFYDSVCLKVTKVTSFVFAFGILPFPPLSLKGDVAATRESSLGFWGVFSKKVTKVTFMLLPYLLPVVYLNLNSPLYKDKKYPI